MLPTCAKEMPSDDMARELRARGWVVFYPSDEDGHIYMSTEDVDAALEEDPNGCPFCGG